MSNGINYRQNEDISIYMLAASSQIYKEAKKLRSVFVFFEVWLPFLLAVIQIYVQSNDLLSGATYVISTAGLFTGKYIQANVNKKKQYAAAIQQNFDTYIYQMPWDTLLFGEKINLDELIADKSSKYFSHKNNIERLKNWYQILLDELPLEKAILLCQAENVYWDKRLRKRYKNLCVIIFLVMISFVLGIGIAQNEKLLEFMRRIFFVAPLLYWAYDSTLKLSDDIKRLERIRNEVICDDEKKMLDLQKIQKDIWEHRSKCYLIPEYLHSIYKDEDEKSFKDLQEWELKTDK